MENWCVPSELTALSKNIVIHHRGERRVRRVLTFPLFKTQIYTDLRRFILV